MAGRAYRILDGLDWDAVRRDPEPLVGFSEITYLHLGLWQQARMPGIHGCIAGPRAEATVRRLLMSDEPSASSTASSPSCCGPERSKGSGRSTPTREPSPSN